MKRELLLLSLVALLLPLTASAVDRKPVRLSGLTPDKWGLSISRGESHVRRNHYPTADRIFCVGVIMVGYANDSSFTHGDTRYWDKLHCGVQTRPNAERGIAFVLDAKRDRSIIYRKTTINLFLPGDTAPPTPAPPPSSGNCDPNYSGACVPVVPYDLDCADIAGTVRVIGVDGHRFDGDGDGYGCE